MAGVTIPGADQIEQVAPARDPGVTASPDAFGAGIGASEAHFGDALDSLGAHLYQKQQQAAADAWYQTYNVNAAAGVADAQSQNRRAYPSGDPTGGTAATDDMRARLADVHQKAVEATTAAIGAPTETALKRAQAASAGHTVDALTSTATFGNNQQILAKQNAFDDNTKLIGSRVLSGDMPLDDALKTIDAQAEAAKPFYSGSQLDDTSDKWRKSVAANAVINKYKAGDQAGGDAIRDKYFGAVPKAAQTANTVLPGDIGSKIDAAALNVGLDPTVARVVAKLESNGDQRATKGSYKGIFQLSDAGFAANGGKGDIFNADENIKAGVTSLKNDYDAFTAQYGRPPSATELYLSHQQGQAGLASQLANPDAPAWANMASTGEGKAKGAGWAKMAIWGNIPDAQKAQFGRVENVTGQQFIDLWKQKVEGGGALGGARAAAGATGSGGGEGGEDDTGVATSKGQPAALLPDPEIALQLAARGKAISSDIKQAAAKKDADVQAVSDQEQLNVFKDIHSANPTMSADDILNNPKLKRDAALAMAKEKMAPKNNGDGYGPGYQAAYDRIHLPNGDPNKITDPNSLYPMAHAGGPLTPAGANELVKEMTSRTTLEGRSRTDRHKAFMDIEKEFIMLDPRSGQKDPQGKSQYEKYRLAVDAFLDVPENRNMPLDKMYADDGPLAKLAQQYRRPVATWYADYLKDNPTATGGNGKANPSTFDITTMTSNADLVAAVKAGKINNTQAAQYSLSMGWSRNGSTTQPAVPFPVSH